MPAEFEFQIDHIILHVTYVHKSYLLFIWNSNLIGCPIFFSAAWPMTGYVEENQGALVNGPSWAPIRHQHQSFMWVSCPSQVEPPDDCSPRWQIPHGAENHPVEPGQTHIVLKDSKWLLFVKLKRLSEIAVWVQSSSFSVAFYHWLKQRFSCPWSLGRCLLCLAAMCGYQLLTISSISSWKDCQRIFYDVLFTLLSELRNSSQSPSVTRAFSAITHVKKLRGRYNKWLHEPHGKPYPQNVACWVCNQNTG